ncbi:hypothetical protein OH805_33320 [Streptomyces sp. NBC_00879]|uniref:hypothetical protein n=1 Tax=unclassified Streptomyces TaxID=2593676 RepID=UPI003863CCAF|nr:hypothetical protein OHA61_35245 [Streptomyces sp. NBC_00885]WSY78654.1 hypothetical protein OH805_33320 [Streptomyces sp. NBC_00879]
MTDRRPHDPADAEKDHGTQVPRDLPDQQAQEDGDPLETVGGHDSDEDKRDPDASLPDMDESGAGRGGEPRSGAVHPEQPVPDEPSG